MVGNPDEQGTKRTIVGYRYHPACKPSTLVLLQHGLSYHKEAWDFPGYSVAQPLANAGYAVVAIDRLGYAGEFVSAPSVTVDMVPGAGHTFMLTKEGIAGTARMVDWLRSRPEAPACS
jgi:dienelactone hydrolase